MPTYVPIEGTYWNSMGETSTMMQVSALRERLPASGRRREGFCRIMERMKAPAISQLIYLLDEAFQGTE